MAAPNAQSSPPPLDPRRIKRLIERLSFDNQFRTHFEEISAQSRSYDRIRNIDPEFPGPFQQYYLSLQYLLHDPRVHSLYEEQYKYLTHPQSLEYVCSQLVKQEHMMSDLDKGILFPPEDQEKIQAIITQSVNLEEHEPKITEVLTKAVEKKTKDKKEQKSSSSTGDSLPKNEPQASAPAQGMARPSSVAIPAPFSGSKIEGYFSIPSSPRLTPQVPLIHSSTPVKSSTVRNPLSFKVRQVSNKFTPALSNIAKKITSVGGIFYKRHPVTAKAALGSFIGGIISTVSGWPGSPVSGIVVGAFAPTVISRAIQIIIPPSQPEPIYEDDFEDEPEGESLDYGQGAVRPGASSVPHNYRVPGLGQGQVRPGALSIPKRAMQVGRGVRTAATVARTVPLMANPIFWIVVVILILLLIVFLFIILPTTSLFPPFESPTSTTGSSNLKITKTGPTSVEKYNTGDKIDYTVTVTNTGSSAVSAEITDTLPVDTKYETASPSGEVTNNTVKWKLPSISPNGSEKIQLQVSVTKELTDTWVVNTVNGSATNISGGGGAVGGSCPSKEDLAANRKDRNTCKPLNPAIPLFASGLSEQQIQKYIDIYQPQSKHSRSEFERRTRLIVEKAAVTGINPVIIMGLWRTESGFGDVLGCKPFNSGFADQVDCAVGIKTGGSVAIKCAVTRDANSRECKLAADIQKSHPDIYSGDYAAQIPITTFDDFNKLYGPLSPNLSRAEGMVNNNCIHSYNLIIETAISIDGCSSTLASGPQQVAGSSDIASCKFYRNDQQSGENCPPSDQGFRCEQSLEFKSPVLLGYIKSASAKTGVPQEVLGAFARVESTVPQKYSATRKSYSISDYTDEDVSQMKNPIAQFDDIDATIGTSNKAMCPRSTTGALGLMQIQPPQQVHDQVRASVIKNNASKNRQFTVPPADQPSRSLAQGLDRGAQAIGKTLNTLTVDDFCDPQKSMIMASYIFFGKMKMSSWSPPSGATEYEAFITSLAKAYYGNDAQTGAYGNSVWRSVQQCKVGR